MILTLRRTIPQAGNATTFIFEPETPVVWEAGNSFHLEVPGDYAPIEHTFTISSAPSEGHIAITTRPSNSAYKKSLFSLQPGAQLQANAIGGSFTWRETTLRPVFVTSGIGITPFRAMLTQRAHQGESMDITVLYGSSTPDIIFRDELDALAAAHPELRIRYVVDERLGLGHISAAADLGKSLFYLSGPSAMVDDLSVALTAHGVLDSQLVRDWFTGIRIF